MAQVGTLTVDLIAQTASFNANIEKAAANLNSQTARMNRSLNSVQKNLAAMRAEAEGLALGVAIKGAAEFVKKQLDMVGGLGEVSQQLGVTTNDLQTYRYIGSQVGIAQEDMDKGLSKLSVSLGQAALGADKQAKVFAALGVSVRDANGHVKTAGQVLPEIADKLAGVTDPAQRAAVEVALFGKAGQKLDTVLTEGGKGIEEYYKRAQELGLVLRDDVIQQADAASDKISELNQVLSVNIAGSIAQNAQAIYGLANALVKATSAAIDFIGNYPRLSAALAGAAVGARFGGPGAVIGAGAGFVAGDRISAASADSNMNLQFRARQLQSAKDNRASLQQAATRSKGLLGDLFTFRKIEPGVRNGGTAQGADAEVKRQVKLWNQAVAFAKAAKTPPPTPSVELPDFLGKGGGGGGSKVRTPKVGKDPLADSAERFSMQMDEINDSILSARKDLLVDADKIAEIERQQVDAEINRQSVSIDKDVKDHHITAAQGELLKTKLQELSTAEKDVITAREKQRLADEALQVQTAANDNQRDLLQTAESLATNAHDRRDVQLRLLDLDKQEERAKLDAVIASRDSTEAEKKIARARLAQLDQIYSGRAAVVRDQTMGPLESYTKSITLSQQDVHERVQQYTVNQLEQVQQGITDALSNALGIRDPFLKSLIDLFIQTNLIQPLAMAMQKASEAGGGDGFFNLFGGIGRKLFGDGVSKDTVARLTPDASAMMDAHPDLFGSASPSLTAAPALQASASALSLAAAQLQAAASSLGSGGMLGGASSLGAALSAPLGSDPLNDVMSAPVTLGDDLGGLKTSLSQFTSGLDVSTQALTKNVQGLGSFGNGLVSVLSSLSSGGGGGGFLGTVLGAVKTFGSIGGFGGAAPSARLVPSVNAAFAANPAIFAAGGKLDGFAIGGLPGLAGGDRLASGMIRGPGTGTSDDILALVNGKQPIRVSNDEAIVNARAVREYWPIIDAMNKGTFRPDAMPAFATGGAIEPSMGTPAPRMATAIRQMQFAPRNDNGWSGDAHFHFPNVTNAREARESGDQAARAFRRRVNGPVRT